MHLQSQKRNKQIQVLLLALTLGLVLLTVSHLPVLGRKQKVPELLLLQDTAHMKETPRSASNELQGSSNAARLSSPRSPRAGLANPQLFDAAHG